jgi:DNA-binding winged helix-turn-helix (wHTH) protein
MSPRSLEILARLESIGMEAMVLCKELREVLVAEKSGSMEPPDFSMFKEKTCLLLMEFWNAPNHILSHDDIRLDVIFDEDASGVAVRSLIKRARQEMKDCHDCCYEIKSISKKGYKLERQKMCQIVANVSKVPKNKRKKHGTF